MNANLAQLKFADKSQAPQGFSVLAPASGDVQPLSEAHLPLLRNGIAGEGVIINLTGNRLTAPFDGTVTELPATLHRIQLKASNGLRLLIMLPHGTEQFFGKGILPQVKLGQTVKMGQLLAQFDPQMQQSLPHRQCAIVLTNPELVGDIYCCVKRVTAAEDVLLTITKDHSAR